MDTLTVVENIRRICAERGTTPTVACKESGAGKDMVTNMKKKGTQPSIERIQLLAKYLDVTTDELLGEKKQPIPFPGNGLSAEARSIGAAYDRATEKERSTVRFILSDYLNGSAPPRTMAGRGAPQLSAKELSELTHPEESAELP
ncbi:MAG: helix-turn-helix transcriptional regulator [Oscillospiraceae bacterium]|nr:helix-turn-helix transcriptional regulator [Oscillospiraceae bacterium]